MEKGRLIAFDYGSKRLGIAVSDPLQIIATPLATIHPKEVLTWLQGYLRQEQLAAFVVGDPRQANNSPSEISGQVDAFIRLLQKTYPGFTIHRIPERSTSKMASRSMIDSGTRLSERRKKENIDMISATLILQAYMDTLS